MTSPLVSVCIPTYNNPEALRRCLTSALQQTYGNFEVVITDDSNNDETMDLVNSFFADPRLLYFKNRVALGSPANWNEAIRKANGDYIKVLHHDDWLENNLALEIFVAAVIEGENDDALFFCNCNRYSDGEFEKKVVPGKKFLTKLKKDVGVILYSNHIGAPSNTFFSKSHFKGFDENTRWYVDVIFYISFLQRNRNKFVHIPNELVNISSGSDTQLTNIISSKEKFDEAIYTFSKYVDMAKEHKKLLFKITFLEMMRKFKIGKKEFAKYNLSESEILYYKPMLALSWLKIPYSLFAGLRNLIVRFT